MSFLDAPPRFVFFTGKGGVGKTALACATALRLADAGKRVLLVSTDPASNLDEMLGAPLANQPSPIPGAPSLFAANLDPQAAADAYRERVIAPYRPIWTAPQLAQLQEQLAGACTTEIAAFDAFVGHLAGDAGWDHVVFDTAPTGHTLRLLALPRAWTGFLAEAPHGASCLGPHAGLTMQRDRFVAALAALTDPARTVVVLVTRPERSALREAARAAGELKALGLANQALAINAIFEARDRADPVAVALEQRGRAALAELPDALCALPTERIPLRPFDMVGLPALRALLGGAPAPAPPAPAPAPVRPALPPLASLFDALAAPGRGLILVAGKGGVGKTTIAAAIAVELAARGLPVHLSTTDPAAHVAATLAADVPGLQVSRIDPAAETRAYVANIMATRGAGLDAAGRALLAEDLRSPCYEELAVFAAFSRLIREAQRGFVVLDTAPTGHTLLLLDTTGAYHRETVRAYRAEHAGRITTPLMRLADPAYTKLLIVTLAEPTPVTEAAALQTDLRRAGIEPYAWVINSSLAAVGSSDPVLGRRIAGELAQLAAVQQRHAKRVAIVPWQLAEPVGVARLRQLAGADPVQKKLPMVNSNTSGSSPT